MNGFNHLKVTRAFFYGGLLFLSISSILLISFFRDSGTGDFEDTSATVAPPNEDPIEGAVYREVKLKWPGGKRGWRVNNPLCVHEKCADDPDDPNDEYLVPNIILQFDTLSYISEPYSENGITADDIGSDNIKTEFLIDRWGGHDGNRNEKFNLNVALNDEQNNHPNNFKYVVPDIETLPDTRPNMYYHHDNTLVVLDKEDLVPGNNTLEGYVGDGQGGGFWQWGWTSGLIRMYFNPQSRPHITAEIDVPSTVNEDPTIKLKDINMPAGLTIEEVNYIGYYKGVDVDGDGYYTDWHEAYFSLKDVQTAGSFEISGHIGTSNTGPDYPVDWDTRYVPDQANGAIKILARIKASNEMWYITPIKSGISLDRGDASVKMYTASDIPERYASRSGQPDDSARVRIPSADASFIDSATEASMFWRTWNGHNYEWGYNDYSSHFQAANHGFHQSFYNVPLNDLVVGNGLNDGKVWINANTQDHAIEGSWPGPMLIVRAGEYTVTGTPTPLITPSATVAPTATPELTSSITPTPTFGTEITPSPTATPNVEETPTLTPTPGVADTPHVSATPTASATPGYTPSVTRYISPTPSQITGAVACGRADVNNDNIFDMSDFIEFAALYQRHCNDSSQNFGICGGKDADRTGKIELEDFVSFASRYIPTNSCQINQ